jgi:CelD/BcsL family acetyltransferase involved in cellulose biosynthesis
MYPAGHASTGTHEIEQLTNFEQIRRVREQWDRFQWYPEADADFVPIIMEHRPEVQGPCVLAARRDGEVEALLIGRVELSPVARLPGFKTTLQPRLKVLRVVYGGMLGDWNEGNLDRLLVALKESLARGDFRAVWFEMLNLQSPLWERSQALFPRMCRGCASAPNLHWTLRLPKSYGDFLKGLDSKTRKNQKRHVNLLENDFSHLSVKRFDRVTDLDAIVNTSDRILSKTYQRGFGNAWTSVEMVKRVSLWLGKGLFTAFFLYANGEARAYQHILRYRGRAFAIGTGCDPGFQRYAVGRYIQLKALEDLCESQDASELDFGFGDAEYKRELCNQHCEEADLVLFGLNCSGLAANAMRTATIKGLQLLKRALRSAGMFGRIKRAWRESLRKRIDLPKG